MANSEYIRQLEQAFISPNMFLVDNGSQQMDGVVTAYRWPGISLIIVIRPLEPPAAMADLRITIDERDLEGIQQLLGEQHPLVPADDEGVVPDNDAVVAQLAVAMKTLRIIAGLETERSDPAESWRQTLFNSIELANWAVEKIERMEANDGTSSDS